MTEVERAAVTADLYEEEGYSGRPLLFMILGALGIWLAGIVLAWIAAAQAAGPIADPIWWVAWAFAGAKLLAGVPRLAPKADKYELSARGKWSAFGCGMLLALALAVPMTLLYSFAPVGVVGFAIAYWIVATISWRLFPAGRNDLPDVALVFL